MPSLVSTSSSVKAFFAFDVIVAGLAAILGLIATSLFITRLKNKRPQYHEMGKNQPLKSTLATHAFLIPSLLFLCLEYATLAALVALQVRGGTDISITTGYSYSYGPVPPILKNAQTISNLSWTNEFAEIFFTLCLNGAVWLHSSHVTSNGTGVGQPSMISKIWNSIILILIAVFGLAAWSSGLYVRDGESLTYPGAVDTDLPTRALHITFRCIVVFSSLSVAIEVIRRWTKLNKNGIPNVRFPSLANANRSQTKLTTSDRTRNARS